MNQNISFTPPHLDPLISVIIPCYNAAAFLPNCMKCLEEQTIGIEHLELIFVDDASSDQGATWDAILAFEAKYPNQVVAIQHEENTGAGGARNTGLLYAKGIYVGFMDTDDGIDSSFYQIMYEKAAEYDCDVVECGYVRELPNATNDLHCPKEGFIRYDKSVVDGRPSWHFDIDTPLWNKLYRHALITEHTICFPESLLLEDYFFNKCLNPFIKSIYFIEQALYHWKRHETATSFSDSSKTQHLFDFIEIEDALLSHYQSLGLLERFYLQIQGEFLFSYGESMSTLFLLDLLDYPHYLRLSNSVQRYFPDYENHPALAQSENAKEKTLLSILNKNYTKEQFQVLAAELKEILIQMYIH
ncbi:hypothetical protein FACS1894111_03100 [Clostridia bacterium]|nr:hypothetical protein FACS1894111_03100 [Clostridia bacterium]